MESNVAFPTLAANVSIATAFPPGLKLQADGLGLVMGSTNFATHQGIEVKVGEDHLVIPYRIHHEGNEQAGKSLDEAQSNM